MSWNRPDRVCGTLLMLLLAAGSAVARPSGEALQQGRQEVSPQIEEIQSPAEVRPITVVEAPVPRAHGAAIDLGDYPVRGEPSAPLTLVEFTDYQCGYCSRHLTGTFPTIDEQYVQTGKIRYAVLDLPLVRIHKLAFKAARVVHCAGAQGRFWEMHDRLLANQRTLEPWSVHIEALSLDETAFEACLNGAESQAAVRASMAEARKAGISATPSFVLARTDPEKPSRVTGLSLIRGAQSFANFQAEIDKALSNLDNSGN